MKVRVTIEVELESVQLSDQEADDLGTVFEHALELCEDVTSAIVMDWEDA